MSQPPQQPQRPQRAHWGVDARGRNRYTDDDRATILAALAANGGNVKMTADQFGIAWSTVHDWADGKRHPHLRAMAEGKIEILADRLYDIANKLLDSIPEKLAIASLSQVTGALAVAIDKMQLLRNRPTSILKGEFEDMSDEELRRRLREAHARLLESDASLSGEIGCELPEPVSGGPVITVEQVHPDRPAPEATGIPETE